MGKRKDELKHDFLVDFGLRVKELRGILGKSQRGMAIEIDIAASYLSELEKGKIGAGNRFLYQLLLHYQFNPRYLYFGEEPKFLGPLSQEESQVEKQMLDFIYENKDLHTLIKFMVADKFIMYDVLSLFEHYKKEKPEYFGDKPPNPQ